MMNVEDLANIELDRIPWGSFRACASMGHEVPILMKRLLASTNTNECVDVYMRLENTIVPQGHKYEVAEPAVGFILAALAAPARPMYVRTSLLELLYWIVKGDTHQTEIDLGNTELNARCKRAAANGLWLLYGMCCSPIRLHREHAEDILQALDGDDGRLRAMFDR